MQCWGGAKPEVFHGFVGDILRPFLFTTPSNRSPRGGGRSVYITEIRRLADGRIAFQIGYEFL
jgi:hypothetical protein